MEAMYTVREAAKLLTLSEKGLRTWIRLCKIEVHKLGEGRNAPVRIMESEIIRIREGATRKAVSNADLNLKRRVA